MDQFLAPDSATLSTLADPAVLEFTTSDIKAEAAVKLISGALRRVTEEDPIVQLEPVLPGDEGLVADEVPAYMREFQELRKRKAEAMMEAEKKTTKQNPGVGGMKEELERMQRLPQFAREGESMPKGSSMQMEDLLRNPPPLEKVSEGSMARTETASTSAFGCPTPEERASNKEALQDVLISARTLADVPAT